MAGVSAAAAAGKIGSFLSKKPYAPPSWASHLYPVPSHTFSLGHFPTPIHRWNLPNLPNGTEVWIKRDDLSGMQLSGNKVRKLEFLMADAVAQGADCVITVGGIQSNHCRATAVAAKYLNLDCYLILRTSKLLVDKEPGLVGNLLVERLVGAHIDLVSKEEYGKIGSVALADLLKKKLLDEGRKPYVIPVGGSNSLGTWGYIEAINEIEHQIQISGDVEFDDIVVACGSGGTIAGLALASKLSSLKTKAKGLGYAMNTAEELKFVKDIAAATGIVLDPVYSGKAAYGMLKDMAANPAKWEGRKILFVHTGGLLGLYDKVDELSSLSGSWCRMDLEESVPRKDGTESHHRVITSLDLDSACRISSISLSGLIPYLACTFISMSSSRGIKASEFRGGKKESEGNLSEPEFAEQKRN
uniref:Tryptophan synthase beta chain-like PALP domain-containing protein n=1 Tax=Leersia perrieri TaxID=77586 RepID=A0A0D9VLM8_9ORYZ